MMSLLTDYIISFKYLKPRLYTLLMQLERILRVKRDNLWTTAAILIQYHVRKFLKRLAAKRMVKKEEPKLQRRQTLVKNQKKDWRRPSNNDARKQDPEKDKKIKDNLKKLKKKYK